MPLATYQELHKDKIETVIQSHFADEIRQLRGLGFDEEFYLRETGFPFSIIAMLPDIIADYFWRSGGRITILRVGGLLRMVCYNPYLIHQDGYAYGVAGYGRIKYATIFDDGTLLQTANYENHIRSDSRYKFIRQDSETLLGEGSFEKTWAMHVEKVESLAFTRKVIAPLRMSDVVRMEMRADRIVFGNAPEPWDRVSLKKKTFEG